MIAEAISLILWLVAQDRVAAPLLEEWNPRDYFPIEVGNTWIWGGEGSNYSVKMITDTRGGENREEITFESATPSGAIQFFDDFVLENGRLYRKAIRFLAGESIQYDPPALYCAFSGKVGDTLTVKVTESVGNPDPKEYFRRVSVVERRPVGTVLGSFADCVIVRMEELKTEDAKTPEARIDVWFARDVGPIKFRGVDKAGRVSEHQVVYARVGATKLGLDPREER
jgi:hypothetical protein